MLSSNEFTSNPLTTIILCSKIQKESKHFFGKIGKDYFLESEKKKKKKGWRDL